MELDGVISISERHAVKLAPEYWTLIQRPPVTDFVVRTLARSVIAGAPLMMAELVIASRENREKFPLAATYPLHFRKTYYPGRLHGSPAVEFARHSRAAELIGVPPPIGYSPQMFRCCFLHGKSYARLSPFGAEPEESNLNIAREIDLAAAAGLWSFMEQAFAQVQRLHAGRMAHGDLELHNIIVCSAPMETVLIDFEAAEERLDEDDVAWSARCKADLANILREAIYLQCALGRQETLLAQMAWDQLDSLCKAPNRFRREIGHRSDIG